MAPSPGKILVVDDNEANRDMLSRRLGRNGLTVLTAEDGQQALDLLAREPFDVVLLDVMMPGIDGIEVLRRVRETLSPADLPIIMVTAKDASEDMVEAFKAGANDYVTKPIDFQVALARTKTQLALKHANTQLIAQMEEIRQLAAELEVRNVFIRKVFGRYLTDEVVESLLETPGGLELGGRKQKVTILMSDLRGFSAMSERSGPEQVIAFLNNYLGAMADVVASYQGTIDEFIGDAVLAIFGAPVQREDDAQRAVACALAMQRAMAGLNAHNRDRHLPILEMGIGVHTGEVIVGNIGSEKRAKYGVVGQTVNLTGRIESFTVGGQVLVSEATAAHMPGLLHTRGEITMRAKGLAQPIVLHDVDGMGAPWDIRLDLTDDPLTQLGEPLLFDCVALDGKYDSDKTFQAVSTSVSLRRAWLRGDVVPDTLTNLRLRIRGVADIAGEELYAKVTGIGDGGWEVRLTGVPPKVELFLGQLCGTPVATGAADDGGSTLPRSGCVDSCG